ncbi:hypothetical protein SM124_11700 [Bacillus sp. 31A1R]|uniref:Uncharacterized protein n=1 Tax=Robertmurraya mangrovi TaxID=3098077 RepID=A0ABU5IZ59_9BACI|nr:hypothetical protein [Bacillus sp. 31A1R]MDZ5472412.1 hypothetical protein [Bacillus sp. 31A1R]
MQTKEIIIEVDKITSGKVNIISFTRKGKQIDHPVLPLKEKSDHPKSPYNYKHHLDYEDIQRISTRFPGIYTCESGDDKTIWNTHMLKEFKKLICENQLDRMVEKDGITYELKLVWVGE